MPDGAAGYRAGRFGAAQVVVIELAASVGVAVFVLPPDLIAATAPLALILLLLGVGRYRGRWGYEVLLAWLLMRQRRTAGQQAALAAQSAGPYQAELAALAPHLTVRTVTNRHSPLGVGEDDLGWFGAIAVTPHDGLARGDGAELRLDWLARLVGEREAPVSAIQVVVRHTPQPSAIIDPRSPCARSYQELRGSLGVPPDRDVWIAVRLGLRDAVAVVDREGDVVGIHRALGATLSRISAALTSHGLPHGILDGAELQEALLGAYGPDPYNGGLSRVPAPAREAWRHWHARRAVHVCYAVTGWPSKPSPDALTELARVPGAVLVSTAIVFGATQAPGREGREGRVGARTLVRIVAAPGAVGACLRQVRASARKLGIKLVRLDGEQAAAVYATTPTAAPYGWSGTW